MPHRQAEEPQRLQAVRSARCGSRHVLSKRTSLCAALLQIFLLHSTLHDIIELTEYKTPETK